MKKHIPNFVTCLNITIGSVAIVMALRGSIEIASCLILLATACDYIDGLIARLLRVQSAIGADLDSLADLVSFGVAPAMILFMWLNECYYNLPPDLQTTEIKHLTFLACIVPAFSALRLAKFNHDNRQTTEFRGLPTPANALFLGFLYFSASQLQFLNNFWVMLCITFAFSILLISDFPAFSLKFKNLKFKENLTRYIFLFFALLLLIALQFGAFPLIILLYIFMSLILYVFTKLK